MRQHTAKLFAIILLFSSCKQEIDREHLANLIKTLQQSNALVEDFNALTQSQLMDMKWRPYHHDEDYEKAVKGSKLRQLSAGIVEYVDNLNSSVTMEKAHELFSRLVQFKQDMLSLVKARDYPHDQKFLENRNQLFKELPILDFLADSAALSTASSSANKWAAETSNSNDPSVSQATLLKIKNDILVSEQMLLKYFNRRPVLLICGDIGYFSAMAFINSSYVRSGDSLEIIAGIGTFTAAGRPRVFIDGKEISLNSEASAVYNFIPKGKPGKYTIPVTIEFYKPDGTKLEVSKRLSYTIAQ
jgi:hypothetical protein